MACKEIAEGIWAKARSASWPAGRDLPKREGGLQGRVGRLASAGQLSVLGPQRCGGKEQPAPRPPVNISEVCYIFLQSIFADLHFSCSLVHMPLLS